MSISISAIEAKIKQFEQEMAAALTNHTALNGAITALKMVLDDAKAVADVVAPTSPVTAGINVADEAVGAVDAVSQPQS